MTFVKGVCDWSFHSCFVIIPVQRSGRDVCVLSTLARALKKWIHIEFVLHFCGISLKSLKCRLQSFPDLIPEPDRGIFLCVDFRSVFCSFWVVKRAGIAIGERWCYRAERVHPPVLAEANTKH